jgi:hypothetical protein
MVTRRRGVKYRHNKTRTTSKALFRKTRHKNKKNKQNKTKKRYQSGGGPKPPAKGKEGVPVEYKVVKNYIRRRMVDPDTLQKQEMYQKENPTAEFDLHMDTTRLPYHVSVKSVKQKTPGQNSFTIMCGKSNRFFGQTGIGKVPYHMVVVIREKHRTDPTKKQYHSLEIDLRGDKGRRLLFGGADDCEIRDIVKRAEYLSNAYCKDDEDPETIRKIDEFNAYLTSLRAKIQLAPKKGNPNKKRATRAQASITGFNPNSPRSRDAIIHEDYLSSAPNSGNSDQGMNGGPAGTAPLNLTATSVSRAPGSRGTSSRGTSSRGKSSRGTSSRGKSSRGTSSRGTTSSRGVNKPPVPQVSYFRSFKPRVRGTPQLSMIPEGSEQLILPVQPQLSVVEEDGNTRYE